MNELVEKLDARNHENQITVTFNRSISVTVQHMISEKLIQIKKEQEAQKQDAPGLYNEYWKEMYEEAISELKSIYNQIIGGK